MSHKIENTSREQEKMVHKIGNVSRHLRPLFKNIFFARV